MIRLRRTECRIIEVASHYRFEFSNIIIRQDSVNPYIPSTLWLFVTGYWLSVNSYPYPAPDTQHPVPNTEYPMPNTQYPILQFLNSSIPQYLNPSIPQSLNSSFPQYLNPLFILKPFASKAYTLHRLALDHF